MSKIFNIASGVFYDNDKPAIGVKTPHTYDWTTAPTMEGCTYVGGWHGAGTAGKRSYISIGTKAEVTDLYIDGTMYVGEGRSEVYSDINLPDNTRQGTKIVVGGNRDTFYPIIFSPDYRTGYDMKKVSISRAYNAPAPDWNTASHKGGCTATVYWSGDGGWGGNLHSILATAYSNSYTTVLGGMYYSTSGLVIYVRGGGAEYWLNGDAGKKLQYTVHMSRHTDAEGKHWDPKNISDATAGYDNAWACFMTSYSNPRADVQGHSLIRGQEIYGTRGFFGDKNTAMVAYATNELNFLKRNSGDTSMHYSYRTINGYSGTGRITSHRFCANSSALAPCYAASWNRSYGKEEIQTFRSVRSGGWLDKVSDIKTVSYMDSNSHKRSVNLGLDATSLEEVLPESTHRTLEKTTNESQLNYDLEAVVVVLLESIKELKEEIEYLKSK